MPSRAFVLAAALLVSSLVSSIVFAPGEAAATDMGQGSTKVGRLQRAWLDPARANWRGDGPRPLLATVWYPAAAASLPTDWRGGVFHFGLTAVDAPFADSARRALVVLSHGAGGSAGQLSWLAEALVRQGFLVAAVNHHGTTIAEEAQAVPGHVLPGERGRDLSVLIDRLLEDKLLGRRIDARRIGAAGFSVGGFAALSLAGAHLGFDQMQRHCRAQPDSSTCEWPVEAKESQTDGADGAGHEAAFGQAIERSRLSVADARVRAVYAIAPKLVGVVATESWSAVVTPVRIVLAEKDQQVPWPDTEELIRKLLPSAGVIRVADAGHYVFLPVCSLRGLLRLGSLCRDPDVTDRAEVHDRIGHDAARFFAAQLVAEGGR